VEFIWFQDSGTVKRIRRLRN